jgi:DNA-binding beta-propeller fold protein YncE
VIDCATDQVTSTLAVGSGPWGLLFEPASGKVYCAVRGSDSVAVIGEADSIVKRIRVDSGPVFFCSNSSQHRVYVTNQLGNSVSVLRDSASAVEEPFSSKAALCVRAMPNPFQGYTDISLALPQRTECSAMRIYDASGRQVKVLTLSTNENSVRWDGLDDLGAHVKPGCYFLRFDHAVGRTAQKLVLSR